MKKRLEELTKQYSLEDIVPRARQKEPGLMAKLDSALTKMMTAATVNASELFEVGEREYITTYEALEKKGHTYYSQYRLCNLDEQRSLIGSLVMLEGHIRSCDDSIEFHREQEKEAKIKRVAWQKEIDDAQADLNAWKDDLAVVEANRDIPRRQLADKLKKGLKF